MLLVSTDPYEYRYISQGDVTVAGLNDAEEYIATDVSAYLKLCSRIEPSSGALRNATSIL